MGLLRSATNKFKSLSTAQKIGVGAAGVGLAVGGALLAKRFFKKKRRSTNNERLRSQVERNILKIKKIQTKRKLDRERIKF